MADISKVTLLDGVTYDLKDDVARTLVVTITYSGAARYTSDKTYAEILEAIQNGKNVIGQYNGSVFMLYSYTGSSIYFRRVSITSYEAANLYINNLKPAEIYEIFDNNPEETEVITVYEEKNGETITHVYRSYTELYSVQKPFMSSPEGTWMVWLQHPMEVI